jgi:hypothetical protein
MRMKRLTLIFSSIFVLSLISLKADAQYYFYDDDYYDNDVIFEIGGSLNAMNCLTDLGGKKGLGKRFFKDLNMGKTHVAGGVFFSAMYHNAIGVRVEGTFGKLSADDNVLSSVAVTDIAHERFNRNQNFRTTIAEGSIMAELHPLFIFIDWSERDDYPPKLSPYLLAGVGYFSYNPQGQDPLTKNWVDLQPLSTEGQGFAEYPDRTPYKLQQVNIPIGIGVRYELSRLFNLRFETIYRALNTDYLDDVSTRYIDPALYDTYFTPAKAALAKRMADKQLVPHANPLGGGRRGSPGEKDAYFSVNLKISLILGRNRIR